MMRRLTQLLLLGLFLFGLWLFLQHYRIDGLEQVSVHPRETPVGAAPDPTGSGAPLPQRQTDTIRVASFNIQVFGEKKLNKPKVASTLADIVRHFDVVAIQEVRSTTQDILPRFIELINSTGRHYDFVLGPREGKSVSKEQYAFVFDTASIEVDRGAVYTVGDPNEIFQRDPLVAQFRVRGPPTNEAFTFSLVDIHTQPSNTRVELDALADVYRAVRDDGRGEDDVILLGDLNADDRHFGRLAQVSDIMWVISGTPTNTRGDKQYDNMIFTRAATTEFTGRYGVFDTMREYNLTLDEALELSDHMPIWSEFSIYEGGPNGHMASRATTNPR